MKQKEGFRRNKDLAGPPPGIGNFYRRDGRALDAERKGWRGGACGECCLEEVV